MGTALAIAKGTSSVGSDSVADKATIAAPKALESRAYGGAGGAGAKATAWRGLGWSRCTYGKRQARAHWVGKDVTKKGESIRWGPAERGRGQECNRAKGTPLRRLQRENTSAHRKKQPYKGHSQARDNRAREGMPNGSV